MITGRLAVSDRIGGSGFQHRKVRREEEIRWLSGQGINTILSFLSPGQNRSAYDQAGFRVVAHPVDGMPEEPEEIEAIFEAMKAAMHRGERIELRGFGVFQVKPRKKGIGRNPRTGREVRIPPGKTIRFKPGKNLRNLS